ncbi:MAG: hypothetical protein ACREPF_00210 [Rhodanobacteraceae bacterium]
MKAKELPAKRANSTCSAAGASGHLPARFQHRHAGSRVRRCARRWRSLRLPLRILTLLAIAATLIRASTLIIPLVLAAFIALGLNPIVAALWRWHVPRPVSSALLMLALGALIAGGVAGLSGPATT